MQIIRKWFENDTVIHEEHYDIIEYDGHLEVRTNTVIFLIVEANTCASDKWLLRVSTMSAFDRWANSTAIERFFDTDVELCKYLTEHQLDIYKELLRYLSSEYDEI